MPRTTSISHSSRLAVLLFVIGLSYSLGTDITSAQTEPLSKRLRKVEVSRLVNEIQADGDAKRGAALFFSTHLYCAKCHVGESRLGPDLSAYREKPTKVHLLESLFEPSKLIADEYATFNIQLSNGGSLSGHLLEKHETSVVVRDASNSKTSIEIKTKDIDEMSRSEISLMPSGLVDMLHDEQQFLDLAKYLFEVVDGGPSRAAALAPPSARSSPTELPVYENNVDHNQLISNWDEESLERGEQIYKQGCANCHGTHERNGSLPTAPRFTDGQLKNGADPFRLYQTLTHGYAMMQPQRWMVPQQKYDVIHYLREAYFAEHNKQYYTIIGDEYLAGLPKGNSPGPAPSPLRVYNATDYGPVMMNTFEISAGREAQEIGWDFSEPADPERPFAKDEQFTEKLPNLAYKGIAVRLDAGAGGVARGKHWMVYDHETMNVQAAWSAAADSTERFIDYHSVQFDGQHNCHLRIVGDTVFENPVGNPWTFAGLTPHQRWVDRRPLGRDGRPYGPHPGVKFRGLYRHGNRTVLRYQFGSLQIVESPSVFEENGGEEDDGKPIFVRSMRCGNTKSEILLRVAKSSVSTELISVFGEASLETMDGYHVLRIRPSINGTFVHLLIAKREMSNAVRSVAKTLDPSDLPRPLSLVSGGPARWPERVRTSMKRSFEGEFVVDEIELPYSNPWNCQIRPTGHDFLSDNIAAVCTWDGDVWLVEGINGDGNAELEWQRIASGLFQPLGLKVVDGKIFVACRDQIVQLADLNGDEEIDLYRCFNSDHQVTEHFHEFAMGLQTDDAGNFYYAKGARHAKRAVVPQHGTLLRVSADGSKTEIVATGFRAPNGVCANPDGTFFVTDQEGHWMPKNRINLVHPGKFYGNLYGFTEIQDPADDAMEQPLCWITNEFDRSPAELVWVPQDAWGPLGGSLLSLSYGYGRIFIVPHQRIGEAVQGGVCQLPIPDFASGTMRARFHPSLEDLFVCGMFSWAGNQQAPGCFHRIRYSGKPVHLPVGLDAMDDSLSIRFSHALNREVAEAPENYEAHAWQLKRTAEYGSEHHDERQLKIRSAKLSGDGKTVKLIFRSLEPTQGMAIEYELVGENGREFDGEIHNTIHQTAPSR